MRFILFTYSCFSRETDFYIFLKGVRLYALLLPSSEEPVQLYNKLVYDFKF